MNNNCRSVEAFLKKGITQKDAHKRYIEYEERRKMNIELVLKDMMISNSRANNRKATSVLKYVIASFAFYSPCAFLLKPADDAARRAHAQVCLQDLRQEYE